MKKILKSVFAIAIAALTFTSCDDVPMPYDTPTANTGEATTYEGAEGDGTLASPYNVPGVLQYISTLESGVNSDKDVYVKGTVISIEEEYGTQYGNSDFTIYTPGSDNTFKVYHALYLGNKKWTANDTQIKVGDEVIVYGKVVNYKGTTPETVSNQAYLYSLNGTTVETGDDDNTPVITDGDNLLANGDFEAWTDSKPDNWNTNTSAGNATLTQSTDAHGGSYSVSVGFAASANKRMAYKELTLKPGTYTFAFYAKATTDEKSQTRAGYVPVNNGTPDSQNYKYGDYTTLSNTEWTLAQTTFTLDAQTTVCLVMMNPKTSNYAVAQDILVDDATLLTNDGGIIESDESTTPDEPSEPSADVQAITIADFNAAAESTSVWYQLTGTVKNLKDGDQYGNFDLEDATGSVYVYGVLSEKGGAKKLFQTLAAEKGIKNGSVLTIIGNRGSYNGKIEVTNAYFVSVSN